MSENFNYTFNKGHDNEFDYEVGRHNLSLWRFTGDLALYNHVFIEIPNEAEPEKDGGVYVFNGHVDYDNLKDIIEHYNFTQHINLEDVAQCDLDMWRYAHLRDLDNLDSFPDKWEHGSAA